MLLDFKLKTVNPQGGFDCIILYDFIEKILQKNKHKLIGDYYLLAENIEMFKICITIITIMFTIITAYIQLRILTCSHRVEAFKYIYIYIKRLL